MAGPFDWARYLTGDRDNPEEDIGQWADTQQAQNRAAIGMSASGDPNASPQPSGGAQAAAQAQAASTLPPDQEPNATKTPVSLGHLMMNLQQYNEREQGFNQALGMGFAAFAQPRDREMVSKMFNVTPADPTKIAQTQMSLASQQQGQDRMNMVTNIANNPTQLGHIAQQLNMDPQSLAMLIRTDPNKAAALIQANATATPQMANLEQINRYIGQLQGKSPEVLSMIKNAMLAGMGGPEAEAAISDAQAYQNRTGKPPPWVVNGQIDQGAYKRYQADQAALQENVRTAGQDIGKHMDTAETLRGKISDLATDPGLKKLLTDPNWAPEKQAAINAINDDHPDWKSNSAYAALIRDPDILRTISTFKELGGKQYTEAIQGLLGHGLRPTQTEIGAVNAGFGQTKNFLSFNNMDDYNDQAIIPMLNQIDKTEASAYGAANAYNAMPKRLQPFVNKVYLPGGSQNVEGSGSESWAGTVHQPLPDEAKTWLQSEIAKGRGAKARDTLERQGFDLE